MQPCVLLLKGTRRWRRLIVSLLSSSRLRIFLSQDHVVVIGADGVVVDLGKSAHSFGALASDKREIGEYLEPALLRACETHKARHVEWVLSNHYVRYAIA